MKKEELIQELIKEAEGYKSTFKNKKLKHETREIAANRYVQIFCDIERLKALSEEPVSDKVLIDCLYWWENIGKDLYDDESLPEAVEAFKISFKSANPK